MKNCLVITVEDYHELDTYSQNFKQNGLNYKFEEVGCGNSKYTGNCSYSLYHAVFYLKKDNEAKDLIKKLKEELE